MSSNVLLEVQNLSFSYGDHLVLKDISFQVRDGESLSLIGASGCGKSTLLHLIAGDYKPIEGHIQKRSLWRRVYQNLALFPWLTVEENIRMGLRGIEKSRALDFQELVSLLDLKHVLHFYPRQLSGGLRQRTEIARALIGRPDGLLLDEPFSALDYLMRREAREYLASLLKKYPMALILVTHDIAEAISLTDRSFVMKHRPAVIHKEYQHKDHATNLIETIWQDLKTEKGTAVHEK